MKINIKKVLSNALPVLATVFTVGGMVLSNAAEKNSREEMKEDIKKELLEDLNK